VTPQVVGHRPSEVLSFAVGWSFISFHSYYRTLVVGNWVGYHYVLMRILVYNMSYLYYY